MKWAKDGDEKSYFFHNWVRERRNKNGTDFLKKDSRVVLGESGEIEEIFFHL